MERCLHLSELGRVCEREKHDLTEMHRRGGVIWPTRSWGWSYDRLEFASEFR